MACVSARTRACYNDGAIQNADMINHILHVKVALQDIGPRLERLDASVHSLGLSSLTLQRGITQIEQQQSMVFANLQEMIASTMGKKVNVGAPSPSLTDFDGIIASHLQPLAMTLGDMRVLLAHASDSKPYTPAPARNPNKGLESSDYGMHEDSFGQEGRAAIPRDSRSPQRNENLRQELAMFQKSLLADLKLPEEFRKLREFLQDDLKHQKHEPTQQQPVVEQFRLMQDAFGKQLSSHIEGLLNQQWEKTAREMTSLTSQSTDYTIKPVVESKREETLRTSAAPVGQIGANIPQLDEKILTVQIEPSPLEEKRKSEMSLYDMEIRAIEVKDETNMAAIFIQDPDVMNPPYHVEDYYKTEGWSQSVARNNWFNHTSTFIVACNAVWIGVEADRSTEPNVYDDHWIFIIGSNFFVGFFFFEWLLRLFSFREWKYALQDGWFKFDSFLVLTMVLDVWFMMVVFKLTEDSGSGSIALRVAEPFRIVRLLKLTRMARLMQFVPELVTMIKGLLRSFRAILSTLVLIVVLVYVFGIIIHGLLGTDDELNDHLYKTSLLDFKTLPRSMWTLIMDGSLLLDNSAPLMTTLVFSHDVNQVIAGLAFTSFALLSAYLILQMLIGVLCDVVARVNEEQRQTTALTVIRHELLSKIDEVAEDGKVTREELLALMTDHDSVAVLHHLKINRLFLMQLQEMVFESKATSSITARQALEMMLMCRSENTATVEVLAGGFCFLARELKNMQEAMADK